MNDPVAFLVTALLIGILVVIFWRVVVTVLILGLLVVFIAGVESVLTALHSLGL
jgi:hypothetical protein